MIRFRRVSTTFFGVNVGTPPLAFTGVGANVCAFPDDFVGVPMMDDPCDKRPPLENPKPPVPNMLVCAGGFLNFSLSKSRFSKSRFRSNWKFS